MDNNINKKSKLTKRFFLVLLILILMFGSFNAGIYLTGKEAVINELAKKEVVYLGKVLGKYSQPDNNLLTQDIDFNLYWKVWDSIKRDYVGKDKINEKELFYGSLKGMVSSLGDPYTIFMDPKITEEFGNDLAGTFEGIGAEIGIRNDILTIIAPLADMPAQKAGLLAGDKIYAIDGESTAGIIVDEAVNKIRGPKDTGVTLSISQDGIEKVKDVTIIRDQIITKSVKKELREDNIYVITISNFNDDTIGLFNEAVQDLLKHNPQGIIIDLRNNPGGYLDTAVDIASEWIEEGTVVSEQFSSEIKNDISATGGARLKDYKTAVLINQGSASASEIVSGALKDYNLATLVGMRTFGKGTVQTLEEYNDGSSVKLTVAKWLTPNGNNINEEGISPDIEVDMTQEDYQNFKDPQLDKAVEILKEQNAKDAY